MPSALGRRGDAGPVGPVKTARVALVTGGARGLGRMVAMALGEAGYRVVVNYRTSRDAAEDLVDRLEARGTHGLALAADVGHADEVRSLGEAIAGTWGRLDALVHCAGPFVFARRSALETEPEVFAAMVGGNLTSLYHLTRFALPMMRTGGWGRIVTFGFDRVWDAPGWPGRAAYAAAKTGLLSFTRSLALEEAAHGITCNLIAPGNIVQPYKEERIVDVRGVADPAVPVGRPGTGEDVARVVRFLLEEDSDFITGAVIAVNGGQDVLGGLG